MSVIQDTGQAIVDLITAMDSTLGVYLWQPGTPGLTPPAAIVGRPDIKRTPTNERESQLGSRDFTLNFPVLFAVALTDAPKDEATLVELVENFINTVDANMDLNGNAYESSVIDSQAMPEVNPGAAKPLIGYLCDVEVWKLV